MKELVSWKSHLFISIMITSLVLSSTEFWLRVVIYHENWSLYIKYIMLYQVSRINLHLVSSKWKWEFCYCYDYWP